MSFFDKLIFKIDEFFIHDKKYPTESVIHRHKYLFSNCKPTHFSKGDSYLFIYFDNSEKIYIALWWDIFRYMEDIQIPKNLEYPLLFFISRRTPKGIKVPFQIKEKKN